MMAPNSARAALDAFDFNQRSPPYSLVALFLSENSDAATYRNKTCLSLNAKRLSTHLRSSSSLRALSPSLSSLLLLTERSTLQHISDPWGARRLSSPDTHTQSTHTLLSHVTHHNDYLHA